MNPGIGRIKDRVAIVTGASRGIGKAIALLFAGEGAKVVINYYRSETEAHRILSEIKKMGSAAIAIKADVAARALVSRKK